METVRGYPYPADYKIVVYENIVDTSSTFLGAIAKPITFTVQNITEDHKVEVIFFELDNDNKLSPNDEIYILERDQNGELILTWVVGFSGNPNATLPKPGDEFMLFTLKQVHIKYTQ